jgi:hypothetical protein
LQVFRCQRTFENTISIVAWRQFDFRLISIPSPDRLLRRPNVGLTDAVLFVSSDVGFCLGNYRLFILHSLLLLGLEGVNDRQLLIDARFSVVGKQRVLVAVCD